MALDDLFDESAARKRQSRIQLTCSACGRVFDRWASQVHGLKDHYCSRDCRRKGTEVGCDCCGKLIYRKRKQIEQQKRTGWGTFCSRECISKAKRRSEICKNCGRRFEKAQSQFFRLNRGQYCSRACKDSHGRIKVSCSWPGCKTDIKARSFMRRQRGVRRVEYKTDLVRKGSAARYPLCRAHKKYIEDHLGRTARWSNGKARWMQDPLRDIGTRATTSSIARLMVFSKENGNCCGCRRPLNWFIKPRDWFVDHIIPVFRGGRTNFSNLQALCGPCHDKKSAGEKSEASLTRHRAFKAKRWLTHPEKDAVIASLRREVDALHMKLRKYEEQSKCPSRRSALTKSSRGAQTSAQTMLPL